MAKIKTKKQVEKEKLCGYRIATQICFKDSSNLGIHFAKKLDHQGNYRGTHILKIIDENLKKELNTGLIIESYRIKNKWTSVGMISADTIPTKSYEEIKKDIQENKGGITISFIPPEISDEEFLERKKLKEWADTKKIYPITCIPKEVFISILPFLRFTDLPNLSMVSKPLKEYIDDEDIWSVIYKYQEGTNYYSIKKRKLHYSKCRIPKIVLNHQEKKNMKIKLFIKNETNKIPFHVFLSKGKRTCKLSKGLIQPGEYFVKMTSPENKIICIPPIEWFGKNHFSNVGFSFIIDISEIITIDFHGKENTGIFRSFYEPKTLVPIKNINKKYHSFKEQCIRKIFFHNKDNVNQKIISHQNNLHGFIVDKKALDKQRRILDGNISQARSKENSYKYIQSIIKN